MIPSSPIAPARRWLRPVLPLLSLLTLLGAMGAACGGSHPSVTLLEQNLERMDRAARSYDLSSIAGGLYQAAQAKRTDANALMKNGNDSRAYPLLESALADMRVALAASQAAEAGRQGDECLHDLDLARQGWDEALHQLLQTEQAARGASEEAPHSVPGADTLRMPQLPPTTLEDAAPPQGTADEIAQTEDSWLQVASAHRIGVSDAQERCDTELALARDRRASQQDRQRHLYLAGRAVQEMEARITQAISLDLCARGAAEISALAEARAGALRGILDLERDMRAEIRSELEQTRAQAADREARLSDALQQFQGPTIRITRDARGVVVSLATDDFFPLGKDVLKKDVNLTLIRLATVLNQFPEMKIAVEGHTDNVGQPDYLVELSKRRAQAVYKELIAQGVAEARMTVEGYGPNRPVAGNTTDEERRQNRRVDLVMRQ